MEEYNIIFRKHYRRIAKEGFIESLTRGCIIGFSVELIVAVILYCIRFNAVWIAVICGLLSIAVSTVIFYFIKYRPSDKEVAKRVDMLGLKERIITMTELKEDNSYMAVRQREDAMAQLKKAGDKKIKIKIMLTPLIFAVTTAVLGIFATVASAMSFNGDLPGFGELINPPDDEISYVEVGYMEEEGGHIEGELFQIVESGGDCTEVVAVADDGYIFDIWSDGVTTPERTDKDVVQSMTVFAMFIEIDGEDAGNEKNDEMTGMESDMGDMEGEMPSGGAAGGKYEEYNQVIDGQTYYRDIYQEYYDQAMRILDAGGVVPEYIRAIIQEYFDVIL